MGIKPVIDSIPLRHTLVHCMLDPYGTSPSMTVHSRIPIFSLGNFYKFRSDHLSTLMLTVRARLTSKPYVRVQLNLTKKRNNLNFRKF